MPNLFKKNDTSLVATMRPELLESMGGGEGGGGGGGGGKRIANRQEARPGIRSDQKKGHKAKKKKKSS